MRANLSDTPQARWMRARRAKGKCQCGKRATMGCRCDACYEKDELRRREKGVPYWQAGKRGRPPIGAWEHLV